MGALHSIPENLQLSMRIKAARESLCELFCHAAKQSQFKNILAKGLASCFYANYARLMPRSFTFFKHDEAVEITQRNLPHWEQPEVCYFLTFRTANSCLPK